MIHCRSSRLSNGASLFSRVKPQANPTFRRYLHLNSDSLNNCVVSSLTRYNRKWFCLKNEVGVEIINSDEEDDAEKGKKRVKCQLEVISWRERRIKAEILVYADVDSVWNALTDYEHLADFVPNLVCSGRIPCPHPGRIWLEQRGVQRALYWQIEARVVLDLKELQHSLTNKELHFSMVDGDFKKFEGKWSVESGIRIIRSDLPVNLQALACRAERNFYGNRDMKKVEDYMLRTSSSALAAPGVDLKSDLKENILSPVDSKENNTNSNIGPMLRPSSELSGNWGVFGKVCPLDKPCMVDEVHLRRFDGLLEDGGVHRCVFASITVKAPVREVWNVLTAYESLPEIVPNLAICKVLSRENGNVRILQEGCKGLLYMVLHARVVLDLNELLEQEISFKQIEGDFDSFEGKWFLEQLGSNHTLLKYTLTELIMAQIGRFQRSWGMDLSFMPSRKSFERAGRYDIARALEKWGGVHEVSRLLSLNVRYPNRKPNTAKQDKVPSNEEKDSYVSQDPQKWVTKLKHFDINWVEY